MRKALVLFFLCLASVSFAQKDRIRQLEASGNVAQARAQLQKNAQEQSSDPAALSAYAEFLDQYGDPASRQVYEKLLAVESNSEKKASAARRLVVLDLIAGDQAAAAKHLEA